MKHGSVSEKGHSCIHTTNFNAVGTVWELRHIQTLSTVVD